MIQVQVAGIGVASLGLASWRELAAVLRGEQPYEATALAPAKGARLPASERRRATPLVKRVVDVAGEAVADAGADPGQLPSVFASASGDLAVIHDLCESLASPGRLLSPTAFHNSVHNAAAGYWAIAAQATAPSVSLSAFDDTFAAGLLEAATMVAVEGVGVLLVAYDQPAPPPLAEKRPIAVPFACALVLTPPDGGERPAPGLRLALADGVAETTLAEPDLERLRQGNPAARALPLLRALARREEAVIHLPCGPGRHLAIHCQP